DGPLYGLITNSQTVTLHQQLPVHGAVELTLPGLADVHSVHTTAGMLALLAALLGMVLAYLLYVAMWVNPNDVRKALPSLYDFLVDKWRFDTLYDVAFVRPVHVVAAWCTAFDKYVLDYLLNQSANVTVWVSKWDRKFDETMVDGFVNLLANAMYSA